MAERLPSKEEIASQIERALHANRHPLGSHQRQAVQCVVDHLRAKVGAPIHLPEGQHHDGNSELTPEKRTDNFLVVSATGTGKTRILGAIADGAGTPTLLLTPRKLLNEQMLKEFCDELDIPESKVGIIDSDNARTRAEALKKPYIISTYQSLPTLVEHTKGRYRLRGELGKRPLILLDEAHTAQGEGTSAILHDLKEESIIGGVTATEAGVSQTLFDGQAPIFNLDLVTAIEQGLLANGVVTGVIDVKLDEDWVEKMTKTPLGREFGREQLERFANTPAAIKAMVNFHLKYEDEQFGKIARFPTLVFTQGVPAARKGAELFNEAAKAAHSKARAGFVSGDMDPGSQKQALDDFRAGRTTVLFNDRMLEMGYDLPEATVVYSLKPTQYRHTAEQQLGRVTRKQRAGYEKKYGMDKVALAINVRPAGTDPYTFGNVIDNRPALYAIGKAPKREPSRIGGRDRLILDHAEFHMDYGEVASIIAGAPRNNIAAHVPDNFVSGTNLARHLGTSFHNPKFKSFWEKLTQQAEANAKQSDKTVLIDLGSEEIRMGFFRSHSNKTWFVTTESLPTIAEYYGRKPPQRPKNFLPKFDLVAEIGVTHQNPQFKELWEELTSAAEQCFRPASGIVKIVSKGHSIGMGFFRNGNRDCWCAAKESIPALQKILGVAPPVPDGFLNKTETARKLVNVSTTDKPFDALWGTIENAAQKASKDKDNIVKVPYKNSRVTLGFFKNGARSSWYLAEDSLKPFADTLGKELKNKPGLHSISPANIAAQKSKRRGRAKDD